MGMGLQRKKPRHTGGIPLEFENGKEKVIWV